MGSAVRTLTEVWDCVSNTTSSLPAQEQRRFHFLQMRVMLALLLLAKRGHNAALLLDWLPPPRIRELLLRSERDSLPVLTTLSCYLHVAQSCHSNDVLCKQWLLEFFEVLEENFSHHNHRVRLLTADILSLFPASLPMVDSAKKVDQRGLFHICLAVERLPLFKDTERERQRFLKMLDFDLVHDNMPEGPFSQVPLRFFLGNLKENYRPLWASLRPLITGYALGMPRQEFWEVYMSQLELAASRAELELTRSASDKARDHAEEGKLKEEDAKEDKDRPQLRSVEELLELGLSQMDSSTETPDLTTFRLQLWQVMQLFPGKSEERTRDLMPLFFRFLQKEYYPADWNIAPSQSILADEAQGTFEDEEDQEEKDEGKKDGEGVEEKVEERKKEKSKGEKRKKTNKDAVRRAASSALVAYLDLFAKFRNPNSAFQGEELRKIFFQLLEHIDPAVHCAAFNCLLTYKFDFLLPYKENFLRLLDNKTFKDEIVHFSLDTETTPIQPQHREGVLPVLLRILYAKMLSKTGKDMGGRGRSSARRDLIFNYLAGCGSQELRLFLELLLAPVLHFHTDYPDDPSSMVHHTMEHTELGKVLPLRRMKTLLLTVDDLMKRLRGRLEAHGSLLLSVLLGVAATVSACLHPRLRLQVHTSAVNSLKVVRQMVISRLVQYLGIRQSPLSDTEAEAMFEAIVWPQLSRLPLESQGHPSPLLRLIDVWSSHPRYYPLLKKASPGQEFTPLGAVCALLNAKEVKDRVSTFILDIVHRLLTDPDPEAGEEEAPRRRKFVLGAVPDKTPGVQVLMPHLPALLDYLAVAVMRLSRGGRRKTIAMEMTILAGISPFVEEHSQCEKVCRLLLPFMDAKFHKAQPVEENMLTSLLHLLKKVPDPSIVYREVSRLFSVVQDRKCRMLLCEIFKVVAAPRQEVRNIGDIVAKINAWNPQRIEEPDYTVRQEGFEAATQAMEAMTEVEVDFLLPVLHNAAFLLHQCSDDLPLQWQSVRCLETLVQQFGRLQHGQDALRELLTRGLLAQVKSGLKSKKETARAQFLLLLRVLAEAFPELPSLSGLQRLISRSHDEDFFRLMADRQHGGWSRAMRRLTELLEGEGEWSQEVLTCFLLPLVMPFLLDPLYAKEKFQGVREKAVALHTALCRRLSWHVYYQQYRLILSLLTRNVEGQKFWVTVLTSVLDAFHFDLSKSKRAVKLDPDEVKALQQASDNQEKSAGTEVNGAADVETHRDVEEDKEKMAEASMDVTGDDADASEGSPEEGEGGKVLTVAQATSIHSCILKSLLPQLRRCLTCKVESEGEHKLSQGSKYKEDDEILRVPIAIAMVKLLKQLPQGTLDHHLPGILLRVCHFLRSRAQSVRQSTRKTLVEVVQTLGPRYFPYVLKEMRATLTRGYQLHVLGYSLNFVLKRLDLKPGDLDPALKDLVEVLMEELFGEVAKEKDVDGIRANTFEAKKKCSADSFKILAQHISPSCLNDLITPIRETLEKAMTKKVVRNVQDLLRGMAFGLKINKGVTVETMMAFIRSLVVRNLSHLQEMQQKDGEEEGEDIKKEAKLLEPRRADAQLLPTQMPRGGFKAKPDKTTSLHVLVEFGLELLHQLLKQEALSPQNEDHLKMLNPFVEALHRCLASKHVEANVKAVHCLEWMLKFPLSAFTSRLPRFFGRLFTLIDMYNQGGAAHGVNLDLVTMCFKTLTVLVRDVKTTNVSEYKLLKMVRYCSEDFFDNLRQHRSFPLLKAILSRGMKCEALDKLMETVKEMITNNLNDQTRLQCRQVMLIYVMNYAMPLKKLQVEVAFFLHHAVAVDREYGQLSCLEMLAAFFNKFPQDTLVRMSDLVWKFMARGLLLRGFLPDHVGQAFRLYLEKVDYNTRTRIFRKVMEISDKLEKEEIIVWGRMVELMVEVESEQFSSRLEMVLPVLEKHLDSALYDTEGEDVLWDIALLRTLHALVAILKHCDIIRNSQWHQLMEPVWGAVMTHLDFPEVTAHLLCNEACRLLLRSWAPDLTQLLDTLKTAPSSPTQCDFLQSDTEAKMARMAEAFISHLDDGAMDYENDTRRALADSLVENLVLVTRFAFSLETWRVQSGQPVRQAIVGRKRKQEQDPTEEPPAKLRNGTTVNGTDSPSPQQEAGDADTKFLTAKSVYGKMIGLANEEAIDNVHMTVRRRNVFRYLAALFELELDEHQQERLLRAALPPLQREIDAKHPVEEVKDLAQEVVAGIKGRVGVERFTSLYTQVLKRRKDRSSARKEKRAMEAVVHPDTAARKRLKRNLAKTEAKKRKIASFKPNLQIKRRKLANMAGN